MVAVATVLTAATVRVAASTIDIRLYLVLIYNQTVGPVRVAEHERIACYGRVIAADESEANAHEISEAARRAGSRVDVLVEVDVGLHRAGTRSVGEAVDLAGCIRRL